MCTKEAPHYLYTLSKSYQEHLQRGNDNILFWHTSRTYIFLRNISHSGKDFFRITNSKCYSEESKLLSSTEHTQCIHDCLLAKYHINMQVGRQVNGGMNVLNDGIAAGSVEGLSTGMTAVAFFHMGNTDGGSQ